MQNPLEQTTPESEDEVDTEKQLLLDCKYNSEEDLNDAEEARKLKTFFIRDLKNAAIDHSKETFTVRNEEFTELFIRGTVVLIEQYQEKRYVFQSMYIK